MFPFAPMIRQSLGDTPKPVVPYTMWTRGLFNMLYTQLSICRRANVPELKVCKAQLVLQASRSGTSIALM
jgi:hypothetical protein